LLATKLLFRCLLGVRVGIATTEIRLLTALHPLDIRELYVNHTLRAVAYYLTASRAFFDV
jgi:hypothetical protein